jgi:hypothetical protein
MPTTQRVAAWWCARIWGLDGSDFSAKGSFRSSGTLGITSPVSVSSLRW